MRSSKNIVLSLLLAVSLLVAPTVLAKPSLSSSPMEGFSVVVNLVADLIDSVVSIFDSATGQVDPFGFRQAEEPAELPPKDDGHGLDQAADSATGHTDPNG